jgi:hypothetical protein
MGNMLRMGESSWLFVKFEFGFIAGHGSLIRVLPCSFLALAVNEPCLHLWPHPYVTWCFACTYFVREFLTGFSCFLWAVVRFPNEI